MAVVFTSLDKRGYCDPLATHESIPRAPRLPGSSGRLKLALQKWYHVHPLSLAKKLATRPIPLPYSDEAGQPAGGQITCDNSGSCREYTAWTAVG